MLSCQAGVSFDELPGCFALFEYPVHEIEDIHIGAVEHGYLPFGGVSQIERRIQVRDMDSMIAGGISFALPSLSCRSFRECERGVSGFGVPPPTYNFR